jgi:uncharacterized protein involved in exopolysaccharide biosynthesis/Mrp family chromosome partitioning ATPase
MNGTRHNSEPATASKLTVVDIYFVVFRHKWKIIILTLLGLLAAGYYYHAKPPPYQSDAELLVRYVSDARSMNPAANDSDVTLIDQGQSIMKAEMALMVSFDLAALVASNIGPDRILAGMGGGNDPTAAAYAIKNNLTVEPDGSVIHLTYSSPDPTIVQPVLTALVDAYLDKHNQVHRAMDVSNETLTEETATLSQNIADLDKQLRDAKAAAGVGVINVADSQKFFSDEIARLRQALFDAQGDLAVRRAVLNGQVNNKSEIAASATNQAVAGPPVPQNEIDKYKAALTRLTSAQNRQNNYYQDGFTDDNKLVKEVREQIAAATKVKSELETNYPALAQMDFSVPDSTGGTTASTAAPGVALPANSGKEDPAYLAARITTLQAQLAEIQGEANKLGAAEANISDLERRKQEQEDYYKSFENELQANNLNTALGQAKNSNIPLIQAPLPPYRDYKKFYKILFGLMASGLVAGLGWAFLIEFYLDHSIKRPIDIQTKLKIPFFLSIPDLNHHKRGLLATANSRRQLAFNNGSSENGVALPSQNGSLEVVSDEVNRRLNSYYDALRDRLVIYFESVNLTRKPKLVAVTSTHRGAGVSTIASGLAASLSETGDGRVLLVDMNQENGTAQQFFRGHANCKLDDALESEKRTGAMVQENLYVVTENTVADRLPRALPKRFASLIPKLKASDYDYIIFDMPPVSPTSVTARLAGFMDTVMLVIESEKTHQQVVLQANALLAQSKANVTAVLNKTRHYIPARLHKDFLYDV